MSDMWPEIPAGQVKEDSLEKLLDELWVQIVFKENSIPSVRAGNLTKDSKQQLRSLILREKAKSFNEGYQKAWRDMR